LQKNGKKKEERGETWEKRKAIEKKDIIYTLRGVFLK
jgi:hypothetical protein